MIQTQYKMNNKKISNHRRIIGYYRFNQYYPFPAIKQHYVEGSMEKIYLKHYHNKRFMIKDITR